jgi:hypothetical protein
LTHYVLTDGELVWGLLWETFNNSPRRPRHAMRVLQSSIEFRPIVLYGRTNANEELRRARAIKGLELRAIPIRYEGRGEHARIVPERTIILACRREPRS